MATSITHRFSDSTAQLGKFTPISSEFNFQDIHLDHIAHLVCSEASAKHRVFDLFPSAKGPWKFKDLAPNAGKNKNAFDRILDELKAAKGNTPDPESATMAIITSTEKERATIAKAKTHARTEAGRQKIAEKKRERESMRFIKASPPAKVAKK